MNIKRVLIIVINILTVFAVLVSQKGSCSEMIYAKASNFSLEMNQKTKSITLKTNQTYEYNIYNRDNSVLQSGTCKSKVEIKNVIQSRVYGFELLEKKKLAYKGTFYVTKKDKVVVEHNTKEQIKKRCKTVSVNKTTKLRITKDTELLYLKFVPRQNGYYNIKVKGKINTIEKIYTTDFNYISPESSNQTKSTVRYEFLKGKSYYIIVPNYKRVSGVCNVYITFHRKTYTLQEPQNIMLNEILPTQHNIINKNSWYRFIPSKTGSYKIYSTGSANTKATLYSKGCSTILDTNKNFLNSKNFSIAKTLLKGEEYLICTTATTNQKYEVGIMNISEPNDPLFHNQWGILNANTSYDINLLPALEYTQGAGVKIGIADSGLDVSHKEFNNNRGLLLGYNFIHDSKDLLPETELSSTVSAKFGHGTHTFGIIAAEMNNSEGICGVASDAEVIPLKVLGKRLKDESNCIGSVAAFIKSIEYAQANDIKIMNCSFGGSVPSQAEKDAMSQSDILFIISAGNNGFDLSTKPMYPASYKLDNSIVVASIGIDATISDSSNFGNACDIAAPGENIYCTFQDNEYGQESGTSFAAPFVSGVAGLMLSVNKNLSAIQIKDIITNTDNITKIDTLNGKVRSGGIINAYKCVTESFNYNSEVECFVQSNSKELYCDETQFVTLFPKENRTNQIIVKVSNKDSINSLVNEYNKSSLINSIRVVDELPSIDSYLIEVENKQFLQSVINYLLNHKEVIYAEFNYTR